MSSIKIVKKDFEEDPQNMLVRGIVLGLLDELQQRGLDLRPRVSEVRDGETDDGEEAVCFEVTLDDVPGGPS